MDASTSAYSSAAGSRDNDNGRPSKRARTGARVTEDDSLSNTEQPYDMGQDLVFDIDQIEAQDSDQIDLAGEVLTQSREIDDDEDDEQAPVALEENPPDVEATFEERARELLAYMGVQDTNKSSWSSIFLDLCEPGEYVHSLKSFLADCKLRLSYRGQSSEPIDAFLERKDRQSWATHDARIDADWDRLASEIVSLSEDNIDLASLSKPSGPQNAVLTCNWHYPTWRTNNPLWSHVMDPTNPSLLAEKKKMGLSSLVRTQNRLPIRENYQKGGINWDETYPNWTTIEEKCLEFNRSLNRHSKLILVIGTENVRSFEQIVEIDDTVEVIPVKLRIPLVQMFGDAPSFKIIRDRVTKQVRHVVFFSYHTQTFFSRDVQMSCRAYHDLLWNAVADMAMIGAPQHGEMYFTRQVEINRPDNKRDIYKNSQFHLAVRLRSAEKRSGVNLPEGVARRAFRKTIDKRPELSLLPDSSGSFVKCLLMFFISRAQQKINDPTWRRGPEYDRMYASHMQNLEVHRAAGQAKGRATRKTQAYKDSDKGKYSVASLKRSATLPRNKQAERVAALLKVRQVQALRDADVSTLDVKQRGMQERVRRLQTMNKKELSVFFRQYVVWWAKWQPAGLRHDGDGCPDPDNFDYDGQDHPAVKLSGVFKPDEKKAFVVEQQQSDQEDD